VGGQAEVELGNLAQDGASNNAVRQFDSGWRPTTPRRRNRPRSMTSPATRDESEVRESRRGQDPDAGRELPHAGPV
jgi:hypothetical protein